MNVYMKNPDITLYPGIKVTKDTEFDLQNENVKQELKDLTLHSVMTVKGDGYESTYDTIIHLKEGDVLIYEDEGRGYIKPVEKMVSIEEAIDDLENIKDLG